MQFNFSSFVQAHQVWSFDCLGSSSSSLRPDFSQALQDKVLGISYSEYYFPANNFFRCGSREVGGSKILGMPSLLLLGGPVSLNLVLCFVVCLMVQRPD